jgi:hypothetical protein
MKAKFKVREYLRKHPTPSGFVLAYAVVDFDDIFEVNKISAEADVDIDLHELLKQYRQIAHVWGVEDVRNVRDDLNDDQAWAVLEAVDRRLDSNHGITWDTIEQTAYDLFGQGNSSRVERCQTALAEYDQDLTDLLADALHWCRANGQDFDALLATARTHFDAETPND